MAYEDAERKVPVRVCNTCYIRVASTSAWDLEASDDLYRGETSRAEDKLVRTILKHHLIDDIGGNPTCLHGRLYKYAEGCPENPGPTYCL